MLRRALFTFSLILITISGLFAQTSRYGNVRLKIVDADTSLPVAGAVVELTPTASPDNKLYYSTDGEGVLSMLRLVKGDYSIGATFLGYNNASTTFTLSDSELELPDMKMSPSSTEIATVVKEIKAMRASQQGDTLSYNASSFKVASDAAVEGLIQKMPGISIEDGTISAQGEEVKKIYVDGKEFFGDDVATALKSLPAEVVANIEVYDKLSDNAELSGIDDGETTKAINIVTHKSMRRGAFGKLYSGYAYEPNAVAGVDNSKYLLGGNVNFFNEEHRFTFIGLANNLNQVDFSFEDIMDTQESGNSGSDNFMVKNQPGVTTVQAIGLNYTGTFGEKEKVKAQGSYFYNATNTHNLQEKIKWYDDPEYTDESTTNEDTRNLNHRFSGRVDWKISDAQSLMIRPSFSYQMNDPMRIYEGLRTGDGYGVEDGYTEGYRDISSRSDGYWNGYNASMGYNYRLRLNDKGRMITLGGWMSSNDYSNEFKTEDYIYSYSDILEEKLKEQRYQLKQSPSVYQKLSTNLMYVEPLGTNFSFSANYKYDVSYQESENMTYVADEDYNIVEVNTNASSTTDSRYNVHKAGAGFRYFKGKTNFIAKGYFENATLDSHVMQKGSTDSPKRTFQNFTYFSMANIFINQENSLKFRLNSYTSNPSLWKLKDIYNIGNYMTKGNPDLDPSYSNQLRAQYTHSNLEKGSSLMYMIWARNTMNYMGEHIVYEPKDFFQITGIDENPLQYKTYANLDNQWELYTRLTYGFPVEFLKSNLNLSLAMSYKKEPSVIGGEIQSDGSILGGNITNSDNVGYKASAVLGSNISENVDFTLSWRGNYNVATNNSDIMDTSNEYVSQFADAAMKFVLPLGFTLTSSVSYKQHLGITDDYNEQSVMCNIFVGKKVFKNQRGEVNAGVCDLLDQNTSFSRSTGTNYTQNLTNSVIGRYFTVQFIYNLRLFARGASQNMDDYKVKDNFDDRGQGYE